MARPSDIEVGREELAKLIAEKLVVKPDEITIVWNVGGDGVFKGVIVRFL